MTTSRSIAATLALLLVLSGCAAQTPTAAPTPPATSPSSTPSATPEPAPTPAAPEQVANGDCTELASTAEVSKAAGGPVPEPRTPSLEGIELTIASVGGIHCLWAYADGGSAIDPSVGLDVYPMTAFPTAKSSRSCEKADFGGGPVVSCSFTEAGTGAEAAFLVEGFLVGPLGAPKKDVEASITALLALVAKTTENAVPFARPEPTPDAWPQKVDCAELKTAAGIEGKKAVDYPPSHGFGRLDALQSSCEFESFRVETFADGAWIEERVKPREGVTALKSSGDYRSYDVPTGTFYVVPNQMWVFDGVNALSITSETKVGSDFDSLVEPLLAALNDM